MFAYKIEENISLELFEITDAEDLLELINSNRSYLREWLGWVDGIKEISDTKSFIKDTKEQFASNNGFQVGIWSKKRLIGVIGFLEIDWKDKKN